MVCLLPQPFYEVVPMSHGKSQGKRRRSPPQLPQPVNVEPAQASQSRSMPAATSAPERIGTHLRHARDERGEVLQDIAAYLCIRPAYLAALENGHYDQLPAPAYAAGFLRSYATYLGLDAEKILQGFRHEVRGRAHPPQLVMPQPIAEGKTPGAPILLAAGLLGLLVYAGWYVMASRDRAEIAEPPPLPQITESKPAETSATPLTNAPVLTTLNATPMETPAPSADAAPTTPPASETTPTANSEEISSRAGISSTVASTPVDPSNGPKPSAQPPQGTVYGEPGTARLILRATRDSWLLVQDSKGATLFSRVLKTGESWHAPNLKGMKLTTGNAGGLVMRVDGVDLPKLGSLSEVVHDVQLDQILTQSTPPMTAPAPETNDIASPPMTPKPFTPAPVPSSESLRPSSAQGIRLESD